METLILPFKKWPLIAPIVKREFNDAMPTTEDQGGFLAAMEGEKVAGFMHIETLLHFNSVYIAPEYRGNGLARSLVIEAVARIPEGFSAVWFRPIDQAGGRTAQRFGGREMGTFTVYRKDS